MGKVVGIDLGTTNSCVAVMERGEPVVIANREGSRTTPSVVAIDESGELLVGQIARRQAATNPAHTVFAAKRLIGRDFEDEDVVRFRSVAPFEIVPGSNGDARVSLRGKECSPEEISAATLRRMKETAQDYLGEEVTDAVITVPAYFNDAQRQSTKDAGRIAGLNVLRIIHEPTAAALAYGLVSSEKEQIAVFDLGGGTFDISVLRIGDGVFEVLASCGDTCLGGEDFDQLIVNDLAERFLRSQGMDLREDPMALQRLREAAERAKRELSSCLETEVNLPFICAEGGEPKHLIESVTREHVSELVEALVARLEAPCRTALADAGVEADALDHVILVGGMTRMPRVVEKVGEIFGKPAYTGVNPDEVVAVGAAIQGSVLAGESDQVLLLDVVPLSLGIETQGGVMTPIMPRNTTIPIRKAQVFSTTEDNQNLVRVHILQGEREMAADNQSLGRFELLGIPPAPRGVPQIEVTFDIDADGILDVSARDLGTEQRKEVRLEAGRGLGDAEVARLVEQAAGCSEADALRREAVELRNSGEALIYGVEQALSEYGSTLSESEQAEVREALAEAHKVLAGSDTAALGGALEDLQDLAYKMTEAVYERLEDEAGSAQGPAGEAAAVADADEEYLDD
ncbi:MAG: molecular chaperone DnaK [Myxococcales bacterium]|nr:molecular chaperone DnaK [Myxococcales bacterium]